jgi:hypothetical protein
LRPAWRPELVQDRDVPLRFPEAMAAKCLSASNRHGLYSRLDRQASS